MKEEYILKRDKNSINRALKKYLGKLKGPRELSRVIQYAVLSGGKRLRPILAMESYRLFGRNVSKVMPFACAIEFVHNFSLIHDDLPAMDNDDFRRGKPTCHKKFGEGMAILAGDALLNLAFGIISKTKQKNALKIISLLSDAIGVEQMVGGQALDLRYGNSRKLAPEIKRKIDAMKTAAFFAVSCEVGALAAGHDSKDTRKLGEFGMNLGLAFQIADDIKDRAFNPHTLERITARANYFIARSKNSLKAFNKKTDMLRYIADTVLKQIHIKEI